MSMNKHLALGFLALVLAACTAGRARAEDGDSFSVDGFFVEQMDKTDQAVAAQRPETEGAIADAQAVAAQEQQERTDADARKELSRSLLQQQITQSDALSRWGLTVAPGQNIQAKLAWYDNVWVIGDPGYGHVKFDVLYKGARRRLTCDVAMDPGSHTVEVNYCFPDVFGRGWPKGLYVHHDRGILFDSDPQEPNRLVFYVDLSSLLPLH